MSRFIIALATVMLLLGVSPSWAVPIGALDIEFTGLNLTYDGSTISDSTDPNGGNCDPNEADPLTMVDFLVDGSSIGSVSNDVYMDVSIPGVTGISDVDPVSVVFANGSGYFDLLIGSGAEEFLKLDSSEVTITYINSTSQVQFVFGASVVGIGSQDLPFDLTIGDPVTVSFSTRVKVGSKVVDDDDVVTAFSSAGTGEITGQAIPEPATCLLVALSLAATLLTRTRT